MNCPKCGRDQTSKALSGTVGPAEWLLWIGHVVFGANRDYLFGKYAAMILVGVGFWAGAMHAWGQYLPGPKSEVIAVKIVIDILFFAGGLVLLVVGVKDLGEFFREIGISLRNMDEGWTCHRCRYSWVPGIPASYALTVRQGWWWKMIVQKIREKGGGER